MKSIKKRIMALIMSLCMIVSVFPATVLAEEQIVEIPDTQLEVRVNSTTKWDNESGQFVSVQNLTIGPIDNPDSSGNFNIPNVLN